MSGSGKTEEWKWKWIDETETFDESRDSQQQETRCWSQTAADRDGKVVTGKVTASEVVPRETWYKEDGENHRLGGFTDSPGHADGGEDFCTLFME